MIGDGDRVLLPRVSEEVQHEVELAVVIGQVAKHVPALDAHEVIFGYTIANDVTARDLQQRDRTWTRAKALDTFCPLGPHLDTEFDLARAAITCEVNGTLRQQGNLSDMIHGVPELISYVSSLFTLLPGDVILTGTPAGVGTLRHGDHVTCSIEGLGTLQHGVAAP